MNIYMDVCCLSRPFDDLSQPRVASEARAVENIFDRCENGEWTLAYSAVAEFELAKIREQSKRDAIIDLYHSIAGGARLTITPPVTLRAAEFIKAGIGKMDSYHLSVAELSGQDIFLTTDDAFIKAAKNVTIAISVANPAVWIMEKENDGAHER